MTRSAPLRSGSTGRRTRCLICRVTLLETDICPGCGGPVKVTDLATRKAIRNIAGEFPRTVLTSLHYVGTVS